MNVVRLFLVGVLLLCALAACQPVPLPPLSPQDTPAPASTPSPMVAASSTAPASPTAPPSNTPPLADLRVRQALAYCTDKETLVQTVYPWLAQPAQFVADAALPRNHWAYAGNEPDFPRYSFDSEKGAALLDEAGWRLADGGSYRTDASGRELSLTLTTSDAKFRKLLADAWAEQMERCGVRVERDYRPAAEFFAAGGALERREFEMAGLAQVWDEAASLKTLGVTGPLDQEALGKAYKDAQRAQANELNALPLFYRADVFAVNPALENFAPPDDGIHTWNAAEWRIPGKDTIVIGADAEPAAPIWFEQGYLGRIVRGLIQGVDVVQDGYAFKPALLKRLPAADFEQSQVTYEFIDGLTWSDGTPVSKADYELAYRAICDPAVRGEGSFDAGAYDPYPACARIKQVEFLGDNAYRVTWTPEYLGAGTGYLVPPIGRLPAYQVLADGRKLADVPLAEWADVAGVTMKPLSVGPYVIEEWTPGRRMVLTANEHYALGAPATPRIVIEFLEHARALRGLLAGQVDILDLETLSPDDVETYGLRQAEAEGRIRLIARPSAIVEEVEFNR